MKRLLLMLVLILLSAPLAFAHEYRLQFTPQSGAQGLTVIGYEFYGKTVVGDCSYYTVSAGAGRGAHGTRRNHYNTCTWDLYGNLSSQIPGLPATREPVTSVGTEIIYAYGGKSTTGKDSRGFGFVSTPSAHYSWTTVNGGYADIGYAVYTIKATLTSDGDFPLIFDGARVTTSISGTITPSPGTARIAATTCKSSVTVGSTCTVTVAYSPTTITCTGDPDGFAYTRLDLSLVTDAGASVDFTEGFTVTGVPLCND
jgi:hypothetical protein